MNLNSLLNNRYLSKSKVSKFVEQFKNDWE